MNEPDEDFTQDDIAAIAEQIWQAEGKPEGKAGEHWERALEHLRSSRTKGESEIHPADS